MTHHALKIGAAFITLALISVCGAQQSVDLGVVDIAGKMSRVLVGKGKPKLAVSDFSDLEGRPTEFGRFVAEQLSVEFVNAPGISVVDRANLKSILAEHKLSEDGLINPDTAKKLGQFAGVDVIVIGTIIQLDDNFIVTAKAIATDTAEIVAAAKTTISRTKDTQKLSGQGIGSASASTRTTDAATVTKDFGDLRVTLTGVQRGKMRTDRGYVTALLCRFDLTNKNPNQRILCAVNGDRNRTQSIRGQLRTSSDQLLTAAVADGIGSVCVVGENAAPSAIGERIGSTFKLHSGQQVHQGEQLWAGELTTIPPGETIRGTVAFGPDSLAAEVNPLDEMQVEVEFVLATGYRQLVVAMWYDVPQNARLCSFNADKVVISK